MQVLFCGCAESRSLLICVKALFNKRPYGARMFKSKRDGAVERRLQSIKVAAPVSLKNLPPPEPVKRASERRDVFKFGLVLTVFEPEMKCIVKNISPDGAMIVLEGAIALPERFRLAIDGYAAPAPVRLVWQEEDEAGLAFV